MWRRKTPAGNEYKKASKKEKLLKRQLKALERVETLSRKLDGPHIQANSPALQEDVAGLQEEKERLWLQARLQDLEVWEMKKTKITRRGPQTYRKAGRRPAPFRGRDECRA